MLRDYAQYFGQHYKANFNWSWFSTVTGQYPGGRSTRGDGISAISALDFAEPISKATPHRRTEVGARWLIDRLRGRGWQRR
jgi:hypothetical protein